jgi:uncharacterized SAM-binding protein YcdF (DUF218 family)
MWIKIIISFILIILSVIILMYCTVFCFIFPWNPSTLVFMQQPQNADAVVILEGEYYTRVDHALSLIEQDYAHLLLYPALNLEKNKERLNEWLKKNPGNITLISDSGATSTYDEAIKTKQYCKELKITSLLLVTSSYHSYRAWWIFQKVLPGVKVISVPVPPESDWFSPEEAEKPGFAHEVFKREQVKFALYYFFYGWRIY